MFGILVWDTKPVRQAEKEKPVDFSTGFLVSFWCLGRAVLFLLVSTLVVAGFFSHCFPQQLIDTGLIAFAFRF
jgi:hypothetical protein